MAAHGGIFGAFVCAFCFCIFCIFACASLKLMCSFLRYMWQEEAEMPVAVLTELGEKLLGTRPWE